MRILRLIKDGVRFTASKDENGKLRVSKNSFNILNTHKIASGLCSLSKDYSLKNTYNLIMFNKYAIIEPTSKKCSCVCVCGAYE